MAKQTKTKATAATRPEVLDPDDQTLALVEADGSAIRSFIGLSNLVTFFRDAATLERQAQQTLEKAKALTPPTTPEEDLVVQTLIRTANSNTKKATDFWGVTTVFHSMHRKLTAARARSTEPNESAAAIGQKLHNRFVEDAKRKADEEQARVRREAEARAQADRDKELAEAEAQAVKLEEGSAELSTREQLFVGFIVKHHNDPQGAARNAGFKDHLKSAARLMSLPKIQQAIQAARDAREIRTQVEARREEPLQVEVEEVKPNVIRAGGSFDRSTHGAELTDEQAFIAAVIQGKHGIPWDVLTVNPTKLNEYGRSMRELVNRWPGVRYTKKTTTV